MNPENTKTMGLKMKKSTDNLITDSEIFVVMERIKKLIVVIEENHIDALTAMLFIKDSLTTGNMDEVISRVDYAIGEALRVLSLMASVKKEE